MIGRYAAALALGILVTLGVLFTMQVLIASPQAKLDESGTRHFVDFVRVQREETVQRADRRRDKPTAPEAPPSQAVQPRTDRVDEPQLTVSAPTAPVELGLEMTVRGLGLTAADGEYLPIVKIAPIYPAGAQSRGIEGWCLVEYTVTTTGSVRDPVVVEAEPAGHLQQGVHQRRPEVQVPPPRRRRRADRGARGAQPLPLRTGALR